MKRKTIRELVQLARESLVKAGYSKGTSSGYYGVWKSLETYSDGKGIIDFSHKLKVDFLCERFGIVTLDGLRSHNCTRARAVEMLSEVQNHGYILPRRIIKGYEFPAELKSLVDGYINTRESAGIVPKSIQVTKLYLERFTGYLSSQGILSLAAVDMPVIEGFVRSMAAFGKSTVNHTMRSVRGFLLYAYNNGIITNDVSALVPHISYNRRARIPSAYTADEITKLLGVIDRNNPTGKRDYVIIVLAARLGLRASDICALSFENIKWEENRIEIIQHKTQKMLILPLTEEVGIVIIDYLKNGRPVTNSNRVLVKHISPYEELNPSTLYTLVERYFVKSGIPVNSGRKRGPHALRHSLASAMLENNVPLPVISEVLGHADTDTTSVYLKIDVEQLRKCAVTVPFYAVPGKAVAQYVEE